MPGAYARSRKGSGPQEPDDAFLDAIRRAAAWAEEHTHALVLGAVVAAVIVTAGVYYWTYRQDLETTATSELSALRAELGAGTDTAVVERLRTFVSRYGGTGAGVEARVTLAERELGAGEPEAAIETVRPAMDRAVDTPVGYAARTVMADALEAAGRHGEALEALEVVAERARFGFQRRAASANRARIFIGQGRIDRAIAIYEGLVETAGAAEAQELHAVRLGEARAMASGGSAASSGAAEPSAVGADTSAGSDSASGS